MLMYAIAMIILFTVLIRSGTLIMLILKASYLVCVSGGTSCANLDRACCCFPSVTKSYLVFKDRCHSEAKAAFAATNLKVTDEDSHIWDLQLDLYSLYVTQFVEEEVKGWSSDVTHFAKVAQSQPHTLYSASTKGLASHWVYVYLTGLDTLYVTPANEKFSAL